MCWRFFSPKSDSLIESVAISVLFDDIKNAGAGGVGRGHRPRKNDLIAALISAKFDTLGNTFFRRYGRLSLAATKTKAQDRRNYQQNGNTTAVFRCDPANI